MGTWQMAAPLATASAEYPDQKFILFDEQFDFEGNGTPDNIYNVLYKQNEVSYLVGAAAAMMTTDADLEGIDPDVMEDDWANLGNSNLTILVPEDTSDEQLEAIGRKFLSSMIITDAAQVKRGTCSMPEDPMPDIAEILSAYGS